MEEHRQGIEQQNKHRISESQRKILAYGRTWLRLIAIVFVNEMNYESGSISPYFESSNVASK